MSQQVMTDRRVHQNRRATSLDGAGSPPRVQLGKGRIPEEEEEEPKEKKNFWKKFRVRARAATAMMLAFMGIVWAGHMYVWILVMLLQGLAFREVVNVRYREYKMQMDVQMPLFRTTQWLWYGLAMMFVYGDFVKIFSQTHESAAWLVPYTRHHSIATFAVYCVIFMISVGTLQKDSVKYQVGQLSWTIVTLCIVVGQMKFVANNIFDGLYWFVFPVWLVINNDCWAYFWGVLLGRRIIKRQFFVLSPKKTWEGFICAAISTVIVAYVTAPWFTSFQLFTCPAKKLTFVPHPNLACDTEAFFTTFDTLTIDGLTFTNVVPAQLHAVVFALFASVVAPFGGFLASAIKRAYHVKDFDSIIPGHGGITDRVDCEFIMSLFVYVYKKSFLRSYDIEWYVLSSFLAFDFSSSRQKVYSLSQLLAPEHKLALYNSLHKSLLREGLLVTAH